MVAGRRTGFALLEVLLALAIVGMAILAATAYAQARTTASLRLVARQRLQTAVEAALESVRGGLVPLESGPFDTAGELSVTPAEVPVAVDIDVQPAGIDDLYTVTVRGRTRAAGRPVEEVVWTKVWRP